MNKIILIIRREYLTRVRKRSFIVMTLLGPLLMASIAIVPIYIATMSNEIKTISVIDETGLFFERFKDSDQIRFHYMVNDLNTAKENYTKTGDYALLYIPKTALSLPTDAILYSSGQINIDVMSNIQNIMSKQLEDMKLQAKLKEMQEGKDEKDIKIDPDEFLRSIKSSIHISTIKIGKGGAEEKSYPKVNAILGIFGSILIYFFIFMFGSQVMRGVIEEKTSRIVEVIVSSVKPFQLMMGKIVGVALVGLTQFLLWIILTMAIVTTVTLATGIKAPVPRPTEEVITAPTPSIENAQQLINNTKPSLNNEKVNEVWDAINSIDFPVMITSFIFYFLFGYLLYAGLFAAIGSAVDSEADTQQFMLPITIPLVFALVMAQYVMKEPTGPMAFWLSMIPFTSPVIMMVRIPFGVPYMEVLLSMFLLVITFLGMTWLAGKIYRTGILMYGKKVNYKELWKWVRH